MPEFNSPPASRPEKSRPRVLLVDDDKISRLILSKTLGSRYEVEHAADGVAALQCIGARTPHVVVSDVEMPKMNGLELTRTLKKGRRFSAIPVILVTGHSERDAISRCFDAGADDYLPKPIDAKELHARVAAAVRGSQLAEELEEAHRGLLRTSRQAGQAEVASGILHNVGNALNSVNVSVKLLGQVAGLDVGSKLTRVAQLLQENEAQLLSSLGDRGPKLVNYCLAVASEYQKSRSSFDEELARLERLVDHTKTIIQSQQSLAQGRLFVTTIRVKELVHLVEEIVGPDLIPVNFVKELQLESFDGDESRVLQILSNLLKNAVHAVLGVERPCVSLRCYRDNDARPRFRVTDNGIGIEADALARIFEHGFTTKDDGHGFGLHYSINAAREMGGELAVSSAGAGQGSSFELVLPQLSTAAAEAAPGRPMSETVTTKSVASLGDAAHGQG